MLHFLHLVIETAVTIPCPSVAIYQYLGSAEVAHLPSIAINLV
jgi:hypothetical protein